MHTCIHTYIHALHCIALHYITLPYIHTYMHTYIHTYEHLYIYITVHGTFLRKSSFPWEWNRIKLGKQWKPATFQPCVAWDAQDATSVLLKDWPMNMGCIFCTESGPVPQSSVPFLRLCQVGFEQTSNLRAWGLVLGFPTLSFSPRSHQAPQPCPSLACGCCPRSAGTPLSWQSPERPAAPMGEVELPYSMF